MDIFQIILGIILLFFGGSLTYKSREIKNILLGILLLIMGLAFMLGGVGIRI